MLFVKLNIQRFADGEIVITTKVDTYGVEKGINNIEKIADKEKPSIDLEITDASNEIGEVAEKIEKSGGKFQNIMDTIGSKILGVSKTFFTIIKTGVKALLGTGLLAIIGAILGFVLLIASAFKRVTQENEELRAKIEYIKFALKNIYEAILKPVVDFLGNVLNKLLDFAFNILIFFGRIIRTITGKNIFKKSGIGDFEKSLKSSDKTAKSLQKTLVGFDEAQTLNGGIGGLTGGISGQIKELEKLRDLYNEVEKPSKFMEWFTRPLTKENIMKVVNSYIGAFNIGNNWLKENIFNPGIGYIRQMIQETKPLWGPVWNTMQSAFAPAIENMKQAWNTFKEYLKPVQTWADKLFEPVRKAWDYMLENYLKPAWQSFYNSLPQPVQDALNKIWGLFKKLYNDIAFYLNNIGIKIPYIIDETNTTAEEGAKKVQQATKNATGEINKLNGKKINITTNTSSINKLKDLLDEIVLNVQALTGTKIITTTWTTKANKKSAKGSIIYPKLAMGGIVNMPGRGIPYNGATIAERGAEAVLPLTDSQQMELLGEAIGKYITINATIPVYAYNRQVDRQIQKIQNQQDMVMNR